jgi:prepilin-type processing-associated H-X9-DG protein/prepilin-type N-terminal cleavage/methylation domain-containing protein
MNRMFNRRTSPAPAPPRAAFTLVELMTVIGIIAILIAFMMPALIGARKAAQATQCASNMRQITQAMINYSVEFKGKFPPNRGDPVYTFWYDKQTTGRYIKQAAVAPAGAVNKNEQLINGVFLCPADLMEPTPAVRSYAMNIWACGAVSAGVEQRAQGPDAWGRLWNSGVGNSSQMMLLLESFSALAIPEDLPNPVGFAPPAVVGFTSPSPGQRFVGGGNWAGYLNADETRFGTTASHIAYFRHRRAKEPGGLGDAIGRLNIAFADGHVALHSHKDLYDTDTGYQAMWSPIDREVEDAQMAQQ